MPYNSIDYTADMIDLAGFYPQDMLLSDSERLNIINCVVYCAIVRLGILLNIHEMTNC